MSGNLQPTNGANGVGRLRIGLVVPHYSPYVGGVETHVEHLAIQAAARGHYIEILAQEHDHSLPRDEMLDDVRVRRFQIAYPSSHYAFAPGLWRFLRRHGQRYDILHSHNYHSLPPLTAALATRTTQVFTPHYHGTSESAFRRTLHRPYRGLGAVILRRARRVICVSRREAALLERDFPWVSDRVEVISNGVDIPALRAAKPFDEPRKVILSAGRLAAYKNVRRIVEALPYLDEQFVLRVTGDGPERATLERRVAQLGLEHRVVLLGRVETDVLHRWLRTATIFVTMSEIEAMPLAPLEALACGARVVASDIDAHREIADITGGSVFLLPTDTPPAELASAMARAAGSSVRDIHVPSWQEVSEQTLALYASALPGATRSRLHHDAPSSSSQS